MARLPHAPDAGNESTRPALLVDPRNSLSSATLLVASRRRESTKRVLELFKAPRQNSLAIRRQLDAFVLKKWRVLNKKKTIFTVDVD